MKSNALTVIHKSIRADLFDLSTRFSTAGPEDADAVRAALATVASLLRTHAEREDQGLIPMLRERDPARAETLAQDHHRLEAQLDAVVAHTESMATSAPESRDEQILALYLEWNRFLSAYLAHLDDEEHILAQAIPEKVPPVEAFAQGVAASGPEAPAFLERLGKLVTPDERARIEGAYRELVA